MQGGRSGLPSRRSTPRLKIFQPAQMMIGERSVRVHLLDISVGGALVHVVGPPEIGSRITLDCAGIACQATVRWIGGSRFGVAFDRPLSEADVEAVIATQSPGPLQPRNDAPGR